MLNANDKLKLAKSQQAALDALTQAGERGLDTLELMKVAGVRGTARVWELKQKGYLIEVSRVPGDRLLFNYKLIGFNPDQQLVLFPKVA